MLPKVGAGAASNAGVAGFAPNEKEEVVAGAWAGAGVPAGVVDPNAGAAVAKGFALGGAELAAPPNEKLDVVPLPPNGLAAGVEDWLAAAGAPKVSGGVAGEDGQAHYQLLRSTAILNTDLCRHCWRWQLLQS